MRRTLAGTLAFTGLTGLLLVLPVYAEPAPEPTPVETSAAGVPMGSVEAPAPAAEVQPGTSEPVEGVTEAAPALTVRETGLDEFALVGVTWAYDPAVTDVVVQLRVQGTDGEWGEWTALTTEDAEQAPGTDSGVERRGGTSPLWTGPATGVEAELVSRSGAQPADVQLDLIDPGHSHADAALGTPEGLDTAGAGMAMPPIFSRAQWGADERLRTWAPSYAPKLKAATVHHTADANGYSADQVAGIMRSIYHYHAVRLGWGDIGYNVIVDRFGRMWEGRSGGLDSTVVAAHAGGFNTGTFGISMLGNYDVEAVPQATVDAVSAVIAWKFSLHGINPAGWTTLTSSGGGTSRYAAGTSVNLPTVFGHRDVGSTACPGRYGYARMDEIRGKVAHLVATSRTAIENRYLVDTGMRDLLGAQVGTERVTAGVHVQQYANGRMYWTPQTGARALWGDILHRYETLGGPAALGAPTTDHTPSSNSGYYAGFQRGVIYWSPWTGSRLVRGWVLDRWSVLGREGGLLGFPSSEEVAVAGGVRQSFQGGVVSSSASTGAHEVHGSVLAKWDELGGEKGRLGFPTSDEVASLWGAYSTFSGGVIHAAAATGPQPVWGWVGARWVASGAGKAAVGYPVRPEAPAGDGVGAIGEFSNGLIVSSAATGAWDLVGPVAEKWTAMGGVKSFLGYPTAAPKAVAGGGSVSVFQGGSIYFSPATGAFEVHGWIRDKWLAKGGPVGLGYPTSDEQPAPGGGGVFQTYENGLIYSSAKKGAFEVHGLIEDKWAAMGGLSWAFGVPVSDEIVLPDGVGRASEFSSGAAIYFSPATGPWQVRGWVRNTWSQMGAERGFLGYPTSDEVPLPGGAGVEARFQGGRIWSSVATGAREVHGAILERYLALGGPASPLGLPTSNEEAVPGGRRSTFQNGTITCNTTTGAITVTVR
ncbi:N-acetylmuramoyl-L-alanine amidase [Blastococcus xanthinilyticus]|uniref:Uncharacterized protein with LGFP repeats n=1 Tax=Blastococcus xanthinilyticus TaxID=1564164 RepID=A0A5S5D5C3_9ACTN|nr:N-acetylmuramoyl-L-alanine amidase [Blastococcus xanthinilyticus]TYP89869.1 uncharacterized protein with LGFP repeats [Blastococcus xanthinilyticus]